MCIYEYICIYYCLYKRTSIVLHTGRGSNTKSHFVSCQPDICLNTMLTNQQYRGDEFIVSYFGVSEVLPKRSSTCLPT